MERLSFVFFSVRQMCLLLRLAFKWNNVMEEKDVFPYENVASYVKKYTNKNKNKKK